MMTFIVSLILYIFGLSKATGTTIHSETNNSKTAEFTAPANVYSPQTPYNPQPSIYPPAMGYPPANTYKPPATNKPASSHEQTQTNSPGYNYMNVSKFYPYPTNM
jgi:hypothetical protein